MYLKLGNTDFSHLVQKDGLKVDYETLVADTSGRNALGNMTVDVINHKYHIGVTFIPMTSTSVKSIMDAISSYVLSVTFYDINTDTNVTKTCYHSTPSITWAHYNGTKMDLCKPFTINFIEL